MTESPARSQSEIDEFNRRSSLIEYTFCNPEDIWNEIDQETKETDKKAESTIITPVTNVTNINSFLLETFNYHPWYYNQELIDQAKLNLKPKIISPDNINWDQRTQDTDASRSGEYTLNPDTIGIDWENVPKEKIKVFDFSQFVGQPSWKLAKYITTEWPDRDKYHIPGIEYWKYILENPDKAPDSLKDGRYHFFFG